MLSIPTCAATPRLMANGMVRIKPEVFEREGGARVLRGLAAVETAATVTAAAAETIDGGDNRGASSAAVETAATAAETNDGGQNRGGSSEIGAANENGMSASAETVAKRRRRDGDGDEAAAMAVDESEAAATVNILTDSTHEQLTAAAAAAADAAAAAATAEGFDPVGSRQHLDIRETDDPSTDAEADAPLPSVSIIVPVHNAVSWLDECLASVLAQSYRGWMQVSIYDDASDDGRARGHILDPCFLS